MPLFAPAGVDMLYPDHTGERTHRLPQGSATDSHGHPALAASFTRELRPLVSTSLTCQWLLELGRSPSLPHTRYNLPDDESAPGTLWHHRSRTPSGTQTLLPLASPCRVCTTALSRTDSRSLRYDLPQRPGLAQCVLGDCALAQLQHRQRSTLRPVCPLRACAPQPSLFYPMCACTVLVRSNLGMPSSHTSGIRVHGVPIR